MSQGPEKKNPAFSVIKWLGLFVIGLFLAYVIVGFWVVPPLLKPKLENELSSQIGRKVSIGDIRLNPLALSSTINRLTSLIWISTWQCINSCRNRTFESSLYLSFQGGVTF